MWLLQTQGSFTGDYEEKGLSSQSQLCFLYTCLFGLEFPGLLSPDQISVVPWGCHYLHLVVGSKMKKGIAKIMCHSVENQASQSCTVLSKLHDGANT